MRYSAVFLSLTAATLTLAAPKYSLYDIPSSVESLLSAHPAKPDYTGYAKNTEARYYTTQIQVTRCSTSTKPSGSGSGYLNVPTGGIARPSDVLPSEPTPSSSSSSDSTDNVLHLPHCQLVATHQVNPPLLPIPSLKTRVRVLLLHHLKAMSKHLQDYHPSLPHHLPPQQLVTVPRQRRLLCRKQSL
jgi:hypothetical protein